MSSNRGAIKKPLTWRERLHSLRHVMPLLTMVWETSHALTVATLVLRLASSAMPILQLWIGKLIIDQVVHAVASPTVDGHRIWFYLGLEAASVVGTDLLSRFTTLCDSLLADKFNNQTSLRIMEHAQAMDLSRFEDSVFYDKMDRAQQQTATRTRLLVVLGGMTQQVITLVSLAVATIAYSPIFLVLLPTAILPSFWGETRFAMLSYSLLHSQTPERRELDYLRFLSTNDKSAKEVKLFGLGAYLLARARNLFDRFYADNRNLSVRRTSVGAALGLVPIVGYYLAYVLILKRTLEHTLTVGEMVFVAGAFMRMRGVIESIFSSLSLIAEHALHVKDLFDFLAVKPTITSPAVPVDFPRVLRSGFEFRNVSFAYAGSARPVLRDVSFRLNAGECLALVGENGAGKTTLVKLMSRLYEPTSGQILLDGVDIREYTQESLHRAIGVVFQDFVRYDFLAGENIGIGWLDAMDDATRIRLSAEKSLAADVIEKLPHGYDQMLGRRFDGGLDLSTGQWQKIALARAYMRDAQILILDEPSASLDAEAEHEVFRRFGELTQRKTTLLISHRLSSVRMADRILVLADGGVQEQGSHEQLIASGGRYAKLFSMQASGYLP
ncbi:MULTISPECIES: ABC transporter ATP-binding protein [unclassified Dyella]|uniref:ABC transporter ATP-binding protein n=1 Tax=unclassified Dyella TaxID=2634549 RepID=UPI000C8353D3|nr:MULTISPECIES: ABC transporter ATP-binding protein [unclassified Dyella]MDR3443916.1 ABC transporter ATP-binding protein [Dyella sp.]PMQ05189.1 putative ABC transporter ATP-binding protein [Dyella sp. AD56]